MSYKNLLLVLLCMLALAGSASADLTYRALLVGCDQWFADVGPMKTAMLQWDTEYWEAGNIVTMQDPTGPQVLAQIGNMMAGTDFFLFAYTGHGSSGGNYGSLESGAALNTDDEWLCTPTNTPASWLSDDELTNALSGFSGSVLAFLDSCHSGGFWNGNDEGDLEKLSNAALYAACAEDTTAPGNSPLWWNAINGCDDGDARYGDDIITVQEWYTFSQTAVPSYIFGDIRSTPVFAIPEPAGPLLGVIGLGIVGRIRRRFA